MTQQPVIDTTIETGDTDTTGKRWAQAVVGDSGRILAGYDQYGTFHCFVDAEALFTVMYAQLALLTELALDAS